MKNFSTLAELISFQAAKHNNPNAFNFKEDGQLRSFSNQKFKEEVFYFACGLRELGIRKNQRVANFSYQNPIWLIVDLGSILAGAVTVPIFSNISNENLLYEISDADVKYVFTDNREFCETAKKENIDVKIITYGFKTKDTISFEDVMESGKQAVQDEKYDFETLVKKTDAQDLATIIYTSGSTGRPKGVELTHHNLVSQIKDTATFFPLPKEDIALSFLPLAHIFERMVMMFYMTRGISIHFADDVKNVGKLLKEIQPTLMTAVPRVLEKVFIGIEDGINSGNFFKKTIGKIALKRALSKNVKTLPNIFDAIFDTLVYKKFRAALGGNMRMIICGGAALSEDLERFYQNAGIRIYCGYGMTESSPVLTANCQRNHKFGTVGKAFPSVELKIARDGELLARGPNIMRGYHGQPDKTAEVIVKGWLHTGDLAKIDAAGYLKIIGRKKEVFKTANGKYVSPVPLEQQIMQRLGFLVGAIVIAEGRRFVSVLLFPDFDLLKKTKAKFGFGGSDESFLKSKNLQNSVQKNIDEMNKNLDHWQKIQKFFIATESVSIESGDVTPSMKLKRNVLEEKYKEVIEDLYKES
ncbi:MAG: long-chain fatty acid--CoA ligase [Pseudomonadota bacterium]